MTAGRRTCRELTSALTDYLEDTLSPEESSLFQRHISDCPACDAFVRSFKAATQATRQMLLNQIPKDFDQRLQAFLKARTRQ